MFGREALQLIIEGMQGMGKTTLAHSIFREGAIDRFFDVKIWHGVSGTFNIDLILHEMLESVGSTEATVNSQGAVLENLREKLTGKRYILVLDDVWDEDELNWNNLKSCLSELGSLGSIVIVTTSRISVAFMTATRRNLVFHLERLSEDECLPMMMD
ncbi:putative disease resistance protein RGA3 [Prunus yedoensis var. nudiflora]|uniref:Putative disease resistance protein RGA3 n=1 Tax=Prunus yedoensis var. nudiflora TaxID=2094558 RepID=A0A314U918_PRUYE|nr:putative disease resistance protein RGA3 [Prunus yedoensis var. nudiflora]